MRRPQPLPDGVSLGVSYVVIYYSTVQYSTVQYSIVQYSIVQYSIVQYSITLQYIIVFYSMLYYVAVYYIVLHDLIVFHRPHDWPSRGFLRTSCHVACPAAQQAWHGSDNNNKKNNKKKKKKNDDNDNNDNNLCVYNVNIIITIYLYIYIYIYICLLGTAPDRDSPDQSDGRLSAAAAAQRSSRPPFRSAQVGAYDDRALC